MAKTMVVIGSQWGDEGKGKITNYLSQKSDVVVRYQGGDNAGHTISFDSKVYKLHLIPSGVFNENIKNVLGNGMVINPVNLVKEIEGLKNLGFPCNNIYISDRAHVIFNYHQELDAAIENSLKDRKVGTTKKGIGPCYTDKVSRQGIRMADFISSDFERLYIDNATRKNEQLVSLGFEKIDIKESLKEYKKIVEIIKPMVTDTVSLINEALENNKKVLFEGAQGALLDIDFGTYPFVTSSNPTSGGVLTGSGVGPKYIEDVLGIVKAYTTRVGAGAFPTEQDNEIGSIIREKAHEYGTTTKRPRRVGWLDGVVLKYSARINGLTGIALMLLDILSDIGELKIATAYKLDGKVITSVPARMEDYERCEPIYETLPGWTEDISNVQSFDELPVNAKNYIKEIERISGVEVVLFSVGPDKKQTIIRKDLF